MRAVDDGAATRGHGATNVVCVAGTDSAAKLGTADGGEQAAKWQPVVAVTSGGVGGAAEMCVSWGFPLCVDCGKQR